MGKMIIRSESHGSPTVKPRKKLELRQIFKYLIYREKLQIIKSIYIYMYI